MTSLTSELEPVGEILLNVTVGVNGNQRSYD